MSQEICKHEGCGRETIRSVSKESKCIFHCEKNDWFTTDANGNQDWSKSQDKVKAFWTAFREEWIDEKTSYFSFFVFPEFTNDANFLQDSTVRQLSDTEAKETLYFGNAKFLGRVDFSSATFTQDVDFHEAICISDVNFNYAHFTLKAEFDWTTFTQDANFTDANFARKATFIDATFAQNADFNHATFAQQADFCNATFKQTVNFSMATFIQNPIFFDTIFTQNVIFTETTFTENTSFDWSTFSRGVNFDNATFNNLVEFNDTTFSGNSTFKETKFGGEIHFERCVFDGSASFIDLEALPDPSSFDPPAPRLSFHTVTVNGHFRIGSNRVASTPMKRLDIFLCTFKKDSVVIIDNLTIDTFSIKHLVCLSPAIKLGNLQATQELTINDSTLNGAELNNINLEKVPIIKITYSSLSKTIFNNVQWGDVRRIKADRDTFRQLKAANEEQKNYLQANEFYMMEMETYRKEIGNDKKWWKFWEWSQEWIDFSFGDFVSRFSNDWVRPIWLFLLFSLVFYLPAFIYIHWCESNAFRRSLFDYPGLLMKASWLCLTNFSLNDFAHFINPLAREAGERYESVYSWWLLHKIIGGLIIYQIVVSLRRKTRH